MQDGLLAVESFDGLTRHPPVERAEKLLRRAFEGSFMVPLPGEGDDHERNLLWELFLASRARQEGFEPSLEEPDVILSLPTGRLGIAAKRLRSIGQLGARAADAGRQIAREVKNGRINWGFVALDLSFALDEHAQRSIWPITSRDEMGAVRAAVEEKQKLLAANIADAVGGDEDGTKVVGSTTFVAPTVHYADARQFGVVRSFVSVHYNRGGRSQEGLNAFLEVTRKCFNNR
jgi:hypothetical protein